VVFAYSISYMADQPHQGRFYAELSLFAAAMLAIVMAADLLTLFIAWELVGLSSYLLIAFRFQEPDAPPAATKALLVTRLGDLAMLAGLLLLVQAAVSSDIGQVLTAASSGDLNSSVLLIAALLIFAGAAGKSAQWPLQGWLPDAMVAPTPVSALLHSATMVAAGVFLVARLYPLFEVSLALPVVTWVGATTAVLGGAAALAQTDLKRTLAYSTLSQMGLMLVGLGSGSLIAGLALLIAHALYKATLFLAAGAVEQEVGSREYRDMGGLARHMPVTFGAFVISAAALAGLPVSMALPSKDAALAAALGQNWALFALMLVAAILTALYTSRALALVFLGPTSTLAQRAREASAGLRLPSVTLAVLQVLGLLLNSALLNRPLERLMDAVMPHSYLISGRLPVSQAVESGSSSLALWGTEKVGQCFYHGGP
jgi:NADH-quinone oxidoreductase subunit L